MSGWALDLGTTNSVLARWDAAAGRPHVVEFATVSRAAEADDPLKAPRVVPSATVVRAPSGWADRLGQWGPALRNGFLGRMGWIGRQALDRAEAAPGPAFARSFKAALGTSPLRTLAQTAGRPWSARDVAGAFLRELLAEVRRSGHPRLRDLVFTVPVDAYETYRAELQAIAQRVGVRSVRFVDEPVAAALGYGVSVDRERRLLVVDFGGGTLDLASFVWSARGTEVGRGEIVAKEGRPIGGDRVDDWLLGHVCDALGVDTAAARALPGASVWLELMRREARRVKESLHFRESETFLLVPPEDLRRFDARLEGEAEAVDVSRADLVQLLERRGLYESLDGCVDAIGDIDALDEVLMMGGSTLLPGVFPLLERRFGRDRVRAWQPFEAVGYGAAAFAAGHAVRADFIVHDYAFVTRNASTGAAEHTVIVPKGTRFPTQPDLWRRKLVPTCPLGEPETVYKLVISEVGRPVADEGRRFAWDVGGALRTVDSDSDAVIVPLNEADPTLGRLNPPHPPGNRKPRLDISFGVNADRWLIATVVDLWSGRTLMKARPVVRLL